MRVGLAVGLALLAGTWSPPRLPGAFAAVPIPAPPAGAAIRHVGSGGGDPQPMVAGPAGATMAGVRLPADGRVAFDAPPAGRAGLTTRAPVHDPTSEVLAPASEGRATPSEPIGPAAAASRGRVAVSMPPAPVRVVAPARSVARAATVATSSARIVLPPSGSSMRPVAAFLGDSYTTGYVGAGRGAAGWPAIVSSALGLRAANDAVAGTGFVNPGWTGQPIATRVADVVRAHPRVVFVAGGHNDRRFSTSASAAAADLVLTRLRAALPSSLIVVIGPIWQDGRPPASLLVLRDHLRRVSAKIGAVFIDPLGDPWFGGAAHGLIGPDGIHPTDAGHRRIATLVLRAIGSSPGILARLRSR